MMRSWNIFSPSWRGTQGTRREEPALGRARDVPALARREKRQLLPRAPKARLWGTEPAARAGPAAAAFVGYEGARNHFKPGFSVIKTRAKLDPAVPCIHFLLDGLPG